MNFRTFVTQHRKAAALCAAVAVVLTVSGTAWMLRGSDGEPAATSSATSTAQQITQPTPEPEPQPTSQSQPAPKPVPATVPNKPTPAYPVQLTVDQASSLTVVVNKKHKLPSTFVPPGLTAISGGQLRAEAANALNSLLAAASAAGVPMRLISSYRSYSYQEQLYANYVARDGQAAADTYSARAGHSEHQTGLATDVGNGTCDLEICFGSTAAGTWLAANAQNYGFIIRYPAGKEAETGYSYEPWHLRYLGTATAQAVYASGKTLDQYFNIPAGGY